MKAPKVPPPCKRNIFDKGVCVFLTHSIPSEALERWVQKVATHSKQPVDWHFFGGRARILALGDLALVEQAIEKFLPEHDALFNEAMKELGVEGMCNPPRVWPRRASV